MATPPTFIAANTTAWNTSTSPKATSAFNSAVGDVWVGFTADENDDGNDNYTWSNSGTAQTFTEQTETPGTTDSDPWGQSATAVVANALTSQTVSVTRNAGTAFFWGHTVLRFSGSDGIGATARNTGSTVPASLTLTTTADNSAIAYMVVAWTNTTTARTHRTVNGFTPTAANLLETSFFQNTANYTVTVAYIPDAGTAGAKTIGLSAPTNYLRAWVVAVEVKGAAGGGATNFNGTSALAATDAITAAGAVGKVTGSSLSGSASLTTAGTVGKATGASLSASASLSAAGTMAASTGSALGATSAITTAGSVGTSTGASLAATATLTAAGSVTSGSSGSAALGASGTITAAGTVAASTGAARAATATLTASGTVGASTGASVAGTAAVAGAGVVGKVAGASLAATATITAAGSVTSGLSRGATLASTATLIAAGRVDITGTASLAATGIISAVGVVSSHDSGTATLGATATISATGVVTAASQRMYHFTPMSQERRFSEDPRMFLWSRVSYDEGITLVKTLTGGYRQEQIHNTNATDIAVVYLGGHVYLVDSDEAASLTAAGYGSCLTEGEA